MPNSEKFKTPSFPAKSADGRKAVRLAYYAVAANAPERAAGILERHLQRCNGQERLEDCWIILLDLYYQMDKNQEFATLAQQYAQHFGLTESPAFATWRHAHGMENGIEDIFPELLLSLELKWGQGETIAFLERLILQSAHPGRPRMSVSSAEELVFLWQCAQIACHSPESAKNEKVDELPSGEEEFRCELEQRHPHLTPILCQRWGQRGDMAFIESLLIDDRGDRGGFPMEVLMEVMFLKEILDHR